VSSRKKPPARTPLPKLRKRTANLINRFSLATGYLARCSSEPSAKRDYTRAKNALVRHVAAMEEALDSIAAWSEGDKVTSSFDEPSAASYARSVLEPPVKKARKK
jgi:hypothetical protein